MQAFHVKLTVTAEENEMRDSPTYEAEENDPATEDAEN